MVTPLNQILASGSIVSSAPCRIDLGGTLDIKTFFLPLRYLTPCTFNIAIGYRTRIRFLKHREGYVKVSSKGFDAAEFPSDRAPFGHPLGIVFAIAAYFEIDGIHIVIESSSPPRSALGGSSAAAVALVGALLKLSGDSRFQDSVSRRNTVVLAQAIEESVAGVPCGYQDQLAAAYGGVNAWYWSNGFDREVYKREAVADTPAFDELEKRILLAYCGVPHESKDINGRWVKQFLAGEYRHYWVEIAHLTKRFVEALKSADYSEAAVLMNRESTIRREMTPDVVDEMGARLLDQAVSCHCGARFTGAGGGGCIWALGDIEPIAELKKRWQEVTGEKKEACLLEVKIDGHGVLVENDSQ
jgi:D-glycero-alpha-D-manno-heptose-7-phosphate kinase